MTPEEAFAGRVRRARKAAGYTQAELAEQVGEMMGKALEVTVVTRIETARRSIRLNEAVAIAKVLGAPLPWLIDENDDLEQQIIESRADLEDAQKALQDARDEVDRREYQVDWLKEQLDDLQRSADDEVRKEIEHDAEEWRRSSLGL